MKLDDWLAPGTTDRKIRTYLTRRGFHGDEATFDYCRLIATGALPQTRLYKFRVHVSDLENQRICFHGIIRLEKDNMTSVHLADSVDVQQHVLAEWSRDLTPQDRQATMASQWMILAVVGSVICFTLLNSLLAALPL